MKFQALKWSAYGSAIVMFIVVLMGALVTKTDSGLGCGREWPLCNGKFVPEYTISTMIEYSHRAVTGVIVLLLLAAAILVWRVDKRRDAKRFVGGAIFFTFLQAVLGAMAVVWPQSPLILASHFGLSLLAFACTLLLAMLYTRRGQTAAKEEAVRPSMPSPPLFRAAVWLSTVYSLVVIYLGAYVRHMKSTGGCLGWPLCNGELIPELSGATGIVFMHRVAAALLFIVLLLLFQMARRSFPAEHRLTANARNAFILVTLQVISGAFVTWTVGISGWGLLAALAHTVLVCGLFGVLSYLCVATLSSQRAVVLQTQRSTV
ncbi:heme A synthase [Paenibacillus chartarius]|uniref:Heme A synthase n=1 Tax=Paenibacillus chartarius TaxID=747481 RepID=A0ABV6DFA5_9BACL